MTTARDTRALARCISKCAASSDGRAQFGARREAQNAMQGSASTVYLAAALAAAEVGKAIAKVAAQWRQE